MEERIQKILSAAGVSSRRAAEEIILEGRVRVNGKVVSELGAKADPDRDHIKVDGKLINPKQPKAYIMLNKPAGFVTTMSDPEGRPIVANLLKGVKVRVYPVGRLDYDTEGLLLLTNDGDLAHLVTHPKHELPKTYLVKVKGFLEDRHIESLEQGVFLKDGKTAPARVRKLRKEEANSWVEITIHEGRKRQVRRMIDHTGHSVIKLKRTRVGSLSLGDLPVGMFRYLTPDEVQGLRQLAMQEEVGQPVPKNSAPQQSDEARSRIVRREADTARKKVIGRDDEEVIWGRGEEKRRSREKLLRNVVGVRDGAAGRPASVERLRRESAPRTPFAEGATTGERRPSQGPTERWQGKQNETMVGRAGVDRRPQGDGDRKPPFRGQRSEKRPRWSEQRGVSKRGASIGPARPSGDRARSASATTGRPRPDIRGTRAGGSTSGYGGTRTTRPTIGGKVYGAGQRSEERPRWNEQGGPSGVPSRPPGGRARPTGGQSLIQGRPRPDARGARAGSSGTGYGKKRTMRPAFGGKVYGTRKRGPANAAGPRPGGPKRTGPTTSGPRTPNARGRGGRRP